MRYGGFSCAEHFREDESRGLSSERTTSELGHFVTYYMGGVEKGTLLDQGVTCESLPETLSTVELVMKCKVTLL